MAMAADNERSEQSAASREILDSINEGVFTVDLDWRIISFNRAAERITGVTAEEAMGRKTGARGLRTIIEETLLDVMYEIPSRTDVVRCVVNGETIRRRTRRPRRSRRSTKRRSARRKRSSPRRRPASPNSALATCRK